MIKQIVKWGTVAAILYGLYYLFMLFPIEGIIILGIGSVFIIGYWISKII